MPLKYVRTKEELPYYVDHQCAICLENVDPDSTTSTGLPGCVICVNGHRMHRDCFDRLRKHQCPTCRIEDIRNCQTKITGYGYAERHGGRRRNKTHKKRKTNKRKKAKTNRRVNIL